MAEDNKIVLAYVPSEKEKEARDWAMRNFEVMWENQRRPYRQFRDKTLQQYLDESRKMINLYAKPRSDGRSNIKSVSPLNKLMAILARTALTRPDIAAEATTKLNVLDKMRGDVLKNLYEWSEDQLNYDYNEDVDTRYFFQAFDCATDGLKVVYEGYDSQTHKKKTITSYDPDTGDVKYEVEEIQSNMCFQVDIKPEDFFVWNPYIRNVQKQARVAWRNTVDKAHFDYEFGNYKRAKFVKTGSDLTEFKVEDEFFKEHYRNRIADDQIEIVRVFDRFNDRMVILANGVVLQDSPLPWENGGKKLKKYPFGVTIFSPFAGGEFFWGMSLPYKLNGDVSAIDTLYNLGIEQAKLAVNPPQLTTTENELEDNQLLPGRVLEVDDIQNFRELQFKSPDQSYFNFIEQIGKNIDFSSVDPVSQGQNVKDTTARGQVIAEENARKLLGVFNMMMESLVLQTAKLRIPNIIQFQLIPGAEFRVGNTMLGDETGYREIKVVGSMQEAETPDYISMVEKMAELQGIALERLNITMDYLKNIEYSIKIVKNSAFEQSKSIEIALETEKIATIAKFFPNIFQSASEILFKKFMEAYGDNPKEILDAVKTSVNENAMQLMQQQMGNQPGQTQQGNANISQELLPEATLGKLSGVETA